MNYENNILSTSLFDDTLSETEVLKQCKIMTRKNHIVKKYGSKIKERSNGKQFYIYIERKQISAPNYDALIEKLYDLEFGKFNATITDLYPEWLLWKRELIISSAEKIC